MHQTTTRHVAFSKPPLSLLVRVALITLAITSLEAAAPTSLRIAAPAQADEAVDSCGVQDAGGVNKVFAEYETFGIVATNYCGQSEQSLQLNNDTKNTVPPGKASGWVATAPAGLEIAGATVPSMYLTPTTVGTGYVADFYWEGGGQRVDNSSTSYSVGDISPSSTFGFSLGCSATGTTCPADGAGFVVDDIQLDVRETVNPSITALGSNNLWYKGASGYVRGSGWSLAFQAGAPSGIASMSAAEDGQPISSPLPPGCAPNHTVWQQCPGTQTWSPTVALSGNGNQQLVLAAISSALNTSAPTETIHVDNTPPTVTVSGPTEASAAAGTQHVTATANVGPSGLGQITCSVDGGPAQSYSSSPANVAVSGPGNHSISCTATNRSYNAAGQAAVSTPATWSLDIQEPTVSVATFSTIKGLKCGKVKEHEKVKVRKHGKVVRVKTVVRKVTKCHPEVVMKKICHAGHCKMQRVAEIPHTVQESQMRAPYGKSSHVSGWLGTSGGVALGGQQVSIMTAPNNGSNTFTNAATVNTAADGTWSTTLPPGPSRLVKAVFGGTSTVAPSDSAQLQLAVPASIKLVSISPRKVAWGGTVRISGLLRGGYLPATGELVRLRIGYGKASTTYGVQTHVTGDGAFSTTYTFGAGDPSVQRRFWFELSTLPVGDYAYAPGTSGRLSVLVGGQLRTTPTARVKHHKAEKHHKKGKRR